MTTTTQTAPRMIYGDATVEMVEYRDRLPPGAVIVADHETCAGLCWARVPVIEFVRSRSGGYVYTIKGWAGGYVCEGNWRNFTRLDAVRS